MDPGAITILGKGADGVNGMYAALLDGDVQRVILQSPTPSHVVGPHYLGVLRHTDVSRTANTRRDCSGSVDARIQVRNYATITITSGAPSCQPSNSGQQSVTWNRQAAAAR